MINRAPAVLKKSVAIVQILQAASFVSRIFNSVISLPFCSCIFSTIILCLVTLANLCLYYLIILSKVCVFIIWFFSSKFVCWQIFQSSFVYHLTNFYRFVCLISDNVLQSFCVSYLRVFYKVCVFTIWSPPNWMRSCEKGGSGHLQPKLEGNSEFEETERKLRLWSKLCTTLTLLVSWQGQGHTQTISIKYEKSTLCDISNNLAIAKSNHL